MMSQQGVPYYDLLLRLADFQHRLGTPVRFRFQRETLQPGGKVLTVLNPLPEGMHAVETLPIFTCPGVEALMDWSDDGYILLLAGRFSRGEGEFLLTSKTILLYGVY
jgi:hypothetical protein